MAQAKKKEVIPPEAAPGEYGPITYDEFRALPEDVRKRRTKRVYEKFLAAREQLAKLGDETARDGNRR